MTSSLNSIRAWDRPTREQRRERARLAHRRRVAASLGFVFATIMALGLAALLGAVTR